MISESLAAFVTGIAVFLLCALCYKKVKRFREFVVKLFCYKLVSSTENLDNLQLKNLAIRKNNEVNETLLALPFVPPTKAEFSDFVKKGLADSGLLFRMEYAKLEQESPELPCIIASQKENRHKNRYVNTLPFDHSRVLLKPENNEPGSDYINANYISGWNNDKEYIASQGPLKVTVRDFWKMILENDCRMIVMLARLIENGKEKCAQYWPSDEDPLILDNEIVIELKSEKVFSDFTIRQLTVQKFQETSPIQVKQMQFTEWADFGAPKSEDGMVNFIRAVKDNMTSDSNSPIVVHCSAGVGRTGTFIAIDYMMNSIYDNDVIDVYNMALEMRHNRSKMIQSEEQYIFLYRCLDYVFQDDNSTNKVRTMKRSRKDEPVYENTKYSVMKTFEKQKLETASNELTHVVTDKEIASTSKFLEYATLALSESNSEETSAETKY